MLIGNSFPLSLVHRKVIIEPSTQSALLEAMQRGDWQSFWGHDNTVDAASAIACADLSPNPPRPALTLTPDGLPSLNGHTHTECWVISPEYKVPGYRPAPGEIVGSEKITHWHILNMTWVDHA